MNNINIVEPSFIKEIKDNLRANGIFLFKEIRKEALAMAHRNKNPIMEQAIVSGIIVKTTFDVLNEDEEEMIMLYSKIKELLASLL